MYLRILKYPRNKFRFLNLILPLIEKVKADNYIEPFVGSGSVVLNINQNNYTNIIANDIEDRLINFFNWLKKDDFNFQNLNSFYEDLIKIHGNPGRIKNSFYSMRNDGNRFFKTNSLYEAMFYYIHSRNVMNSTVRIGPKGFNSSWGNRGYDLNLNEESLNEIKNKISKVTFLNIDFSKLLIKYNNKNTIMFLDPPYFETLKSTDYNKQFDGKLHSFIDALEKTKMKFVLTLNRIDRLDNLFNKIKIRDLKKVLGGKTNKGLITGEEMIYYNF